MEGPCMECGASLLCARDTEFATLGALTLHEANRLLGDIHTEAEHLGRLISDLLALAHGDEGQTQFDREPVRLDQLALAVAANAEHLSAEQGVTVQVQMAEPVTVVGDEARLIGVV